MESLEMVEAERLGVLELLGSLDLERHQLDRIRLQHGHHFGNQQRVDLAEVDLDHVDCAQQWVDVVHVADEVVERDPVAALAQVMTALDDAVVDGGLLEQLDDDPVGGQRLDELAEQEFGVDVEETIHRSDHLCKADFGEHVGDHRRCREHVVVELGDVALGRAKQQLVAGQVALAVDDGLASDVDVLEQIVGHGECVTAATCSARGPQARSRPQPRSNASKRGSTPSRTRVRRLRAANSLSTTSAPMPAGSIAVTAERSMWMGARSLPPTASATAGSNARYAVQSSFCCATIATLFSPLRSRAPSDRRENREVAVN